jgi:uncharacterized protein YxjI
MLARRPAPVPTAQVPLADLLASARRVVVRQARDWTELVSIEAANRYALLDESGALGGLALELPGSFLLRQFLKARRPFEMEVREAGPASRTLLRFRRPWRWWLSRLEVTDGAGRVLGAVQERFALLSRRFDVEGPGGRVLARLTGPFWKPWTFLLQAVDADRELGRVEKKWSGFVSEAFTEADTFLVTLPQDPALRPLALGAAILIDFRFFEDKDG